jgi:glutamyl-tRNA synthetase
LTWDRIAALEASGAPRAVRFKVPASRTAFDDVVHGRIEFDPAHVEDFVILRSDGQPTYHLSVVADDVDMAITHVIRGDDHISNTPKHVMLFEALGAPVPVFAHVPLILGSDRKRLSKRHGATSVTEYQRQGYLPAAMVNFLALLGWSPGGDRELMTVGEMVELFSLEAISGSNAVFNTEKLDWMNGQYIARMPIEHLAVAIEPYLLDAGLGPVPALRQDRDGQSAGEVDEREQWYRRVLELLRPRARRLPDFADLARPFLSETVQFDPSAVTKYLSAPGIGAHLTALGAALRATDPFDAPHVETAVRRTAAERGLKDGVLIHAARVAVTGRASSPGLFEVLELLGRDRAAGRIEGAVNLLASGREGGISA